MTLGLNRRPSHPAKLWRYVAASVATVALAPAIASADTVTAVGNEGTLLLSQSWASTAASRTPTTVMGTGANDGIGPVQISDLTQNGTTTSNYLFTQTFTNPTGSYSGGTLGNGDPFGLTASYVVDLPTSSAGAYLFSLNLNAQSGLDNLTARLYEYNANGVENLNLGVTGPVTTGLVDSWSASANGYVASTTLSPVNVSGGYYVLEVAGLEVGTTSGAYSGQLSITPVPLPGGLPLLLGGFAGLAAFSRRRALSQRILS
jgi:hypothetical protein